MIRSFVWCLAILAVFLLLQSTILSVLVIGQARLNLLWIVFVALSLQNGALISQLVGFLVGFAIDAVTASPIGLHAFEFALAGYVFGLGRAKVYFDALVMPALLGLVATLFDLIILALLNFIFRLGEPIQDFFHWGVLIQLLFGAVAMPIVLWVYRWIQEKFSDPRRGFSGS